MTALPNASYAKVSLPTLAKDVVIASSGTAFGELTRARVLRINTDLYTKVTLPTLAKDAVIRTVNPALITTQQPIIFVVT